MEKMKKIAKNLDTFCRVLQICCWVAGVTAIVGMLLVTAFFALDLAPEQVGTGYNAVDLGIVELELAAEATPAPEKVLIISVVDMAMGVAIAILAWLCIRCFRRILAPMMEGQAFHTAAASGLKRLALLTTVIGVVVNAVKMVSTLLTLGCYDLPKRLIGENVVGANVHISMDLTFLVVAAVMLLLSYVFSYGAVLQQQSDETL